MTIATVAAAFDHAADPTNTPTSSYFFFLVDTPFTAKEFESHLKQTHTGPRRLTGFTGSFDPREVTLFVCSNN